MLYISTSTPASVQLGTVLCDFIAPGEDVLVVNKLRRLSVNSVNDGEVKEMFEIPVQGLISQIAALKLEGDAISTLLVLTTSLQLFALRHSPAFPYATTLSTASLVDPHARLSAYQTILVDPHNRLLLIHSYTGLVRVIPLSSSSASASGSPAKGRRKSSASVVMSDEGALDLGRGFNLRLPLAELTSLAFLERSVEELPMIVAIHGDAQGRRLASTYSVDLRKKDLIELNINATTLQDAGSEVAFSLPGGEGFVVLGEESARFVRVADPAVQSTSDKGKRRSIAMVDQSKVSVKLPVGSIQAWTKLPGREDVYVLGDLYGKLLLLWIEREGGKVARLGVRDLGDANSPTALTFVGTNVVYLASRFGDSQLIAISDALLSPTESDSMETADSEGLTLVSSFSSLAPILDAVVVEGDSASASQIVTCSGAYKGGSLRVVRQGVGLHELAQLEMDGIQRIWSLAQAGASLLVLGFYNETRVLSFPVEDGEEEIEEIDLPAFKSDAQTILAASLGKKAVQVTAAGVWFEGGSWVPEGKKKVTLAEAQGDRLVLALDGGVVVLLELAGGVLVETARTTLENEVAALSLAPLAKGAEPTLAVGLWTIQTVVLLSLPALQTKSTQVVPSAFLIRSVLVTSFGQGDAPLLLAGMGDGTLFSYSLSVEVAFVGQSEKKVALGKRPVLLAEFGSGGTTSVFASSERPTILSRPAGAAGRVVYSPANLADINAVAPFDSPAFPGAIAFASPAGLRIGRLESVQKVDIRPVPLEEDDEPRRIAHERETGAFGVICLRRDVDRATGEVQSKGGVKVLSSEFEQRGALELQLDEQAQSIAVRAAKEGEEPGFVVGTALVKADEQEPTKGRLLLLSADDASIRVETTLAGCPYAIAVLAGGEITVAVNSQVLVFELTEGRLKQVAEWGGAFIAISLSVSNEERNELLVGDAMRSVALLRYVPKREESIQPPKLDEVARDFRAHYMTAAAAIPTSVAGGEAGGEEYIGAEAELNLFTLQREVSPTSITKSGARATKLEPRAAFHLGEMVSSFQRGSLVRQLGGAATEDSLITPSLIFTTSAGSIGSISTLDPARAALVSALERNSDHVLPRIGGLAQSDFRAWKDLDAPVLVKSAEGGARGAVDGDFVESLLEWDGEGEGWEGVLKGRTTAEALGVGREEVVELVEELARSH